MKTLFLMYLFILPGFLCESLDSQFDFEVQPAFLDDRIEGNFLVYIVVSTPNGLSII